MRIILLVLAGIVTVQAQTNRIPFNTRNIFLSGANLAWIDYARDAGPGTIDSAGFDAVLRQMHDNGGNALRWWMHTDGSVTPEFSSTHRVRGPGAGTIEDLRLVLDLARAREIGVTVCLWSFDMLRTSLDAAVQERNMLLLTDTAYTRAYLGTCLGPIVDALKGHPALLAWEIINEPEGMSQEFGWSVVRHVPMAAIQRFINLCAGTIHAHDPRARVTGGAWAFTTLTDVPTAALVRQDHSFTSGSERTTLDVETRFARKYGMAVSAGEIVGNLARAASRPAANYYRDDRLIGAGGDSAGVLDFYSVHYYDWGGTQLSPFHHPSDYWKLDKPLVVAEFALGRTFSIPTEYLYDTLYHLGYAGALAWSWTDVHLSSITDMLASMRMMRLYHGVDIAPGAGIDTLGSKTTAHGMPLQFALEQNFPNPFNPRTQIRFSLPFDAPLVTLSVYDLLGRRVAVLVDGPVVSGIHTVEWNAAAQASGVYFCRLETGSAMHTRVLVLQK